MKKGTTCTVWQKSLSPSTVGDVLLRFRGEFARFQNPDDDVIVPMPGEAPGIIRSKMNGGGNSVPPPSPDAAPADNNPFGAPIPEGPLPF